MRAVGDRDRPRHCIALDIVALKAPRSQLHDIDMPLRHELARALVIGEIIALERDRRRLVRCHRMPEILLHCLHVSEQLLLLLREPVRPLRATAVLDEIQPLNARVAVPAVCSIGADGQDGTGGGQRK